MKADIAQVQRTSKVRCTLLGVPYRVDLFWFYGIFHSQLSKD